MGVLVATTATSFTTRPTSVKRYHARYLLVYARRIWWNYRQGKLAVFRCKCQASSFSLKHSILLCRRDIWSSRRVTRMVAINRTRICRRLRLICSSITLFILICIRRFHRYPHQWCMICIRAIWDNSLHRLLLTHRSMVWKDIRCKLAHPGWEIWQAIWGTTEAISIIRLTTRTLYWEGTAGQPQEV